MPLIEQLLEKNPQTLKIVFKNLPLTSIHNMAEPAALAALAADNQGKFWQMHDAIFAMNAQITPEKLEAAARELGLDMAKFNTDRNSNTVRMKLTKDMEDARTAQVNGTPTLFVNGMRMKERNLDTLQQIIDKEAAKTK